MEPTQAQLLLEDIRDHLKAVGEAIYRSEEERAFAESELKKAYELVNELKALHERENNTSQ